MNYAIEFILAENALQQCLVAHIAFKAGNGLAGNGFHALESLWVTIAKVVDNDDLVTCVKQSHTGVRADIARTTSDQNLHALKCS